MLESVLGPGKATVRVAARLSFDQVERTEERFDPNTVIRQEQRTTETSSGATTAPIGTPGVAANVATPQGGTTTVNNKTGRETEVVSYEVGKTVERKVIAPGEIVRLSVAVLLDSPSRQVTSSGGATSQEPVSRSQEELEKLRRLVVSAVGFNAARGDEVQVVELPYDTSFAERERAESARESQLSQRSLWIGLIAALLAAALLLALFRFRRRRLVAVLNEVGYRRAGPAVSIEAAKAAVDEAHTHEMLELEGKRKEELRQKALAFAYQKPEEAAQLLRAWMLKRKVSST
jgi:flagellar M-ring protein FliF